MKAMVKKIKMIEFISFLIQNDYNFELKSVNDDSLYFMYKKRKYYINRLNMLNIELVELEY